MVLVLIICAQSTLLYVHTTVYWITRSGIVWTTTAQNWSKSFTHIELRARCQEWLAERVWWTKSQSSLLNIYFLFILLDLPIIGRVTTTAWRQLLRARNSPSPPWEIDQHTGDYVLYSLRTVCGFFNVPQNLYMQGLWDRAYGLSSLSEKNRKSNRLQMSFQRQHFFLSYLKTLSVGLAGTWTSSLPLGRPVLIQLS